MPLIRRSAEEKEAARAATDAAKQQAAIEAARKTFFKTPAGRARQAFDRGDHVFEYSLDVVNQEAIVIAMVGSSTSKRTRDASEILNSVAHEGWDLVNGSFVFIEQGQQSRDKFMSSGQNVATKGRVVGYYLFRRCEANRRDLVKPWELPEETSP